LTEQRSDFTFIDIPYYNNNNNNSNNNNNNNNTYLLTPWRVNLEKLTGVQLIKKFSHFMEPEGSLPH
jgi:nucleoside-specific outer membrane channel protein Tsx